MKYPDDFIDKIISGDCREILKEIPDESVDLIIADPPYKISKKGNKITRTYEHYNWKRRSDIVLDFGEWDRQWKSDEEFLLWVEEWFKELVRVAKIGTWFYIFFDKQKTGIFDLFLAPKYGIKSRTIFVWVKTNPVPSYRKVNWISGTEFIWVGSKGESKIKNYLYQKEMYNYFLNPNSSIYRKTSHPTEKPENLITKFVLTCSNEGDIVLDPFISSGTTAVVCKRLNRRFIGIEKSKEYVDIARKRLESEVVGLFRR